MPNGHDAVRVCVVVNEWVFQIPQRFSIGHLGGQYDRAAARVGARWFSRGQEDF